MATSVPKMLKVAKYVTGALTGVLAVGHVYTRAGGFGNKEIDLRNYETAPDAPLGSADNTQYKYRDIKKNRNILYDTVEYSLDIYRPEGVTGSNHKVISCKPIHVVPSTLNYKPTHT